MSNLTNNDKRILDRIGLPINSRRTIEDLWEKTPDSPPVKTWIVHVKNLCSYCFMFAIIAVFIASTIPMEFPIERIKDIFLAIMWVMYPMVILLLFSINIIFIIGLSSVNNIIDNLKISDISSYSRASMNALFPNFLVKTRMTIVPILVIIAVGYAGNVVTCGLFVLYFLLSMSALYLIRKYVIELLNGTSALKD